MYLILAIISISIGYVWSIHSDPFIKTSNPNITKEELQKQTLNINTKKIHSLENIPVVYIKKHGYSGGLNHGKLLQQNIHEIVNILHEEILKTKTLSGFFVHTYLLQKAHKLDRHIPQIYREEMKGIADASGVSYNDILLLNTYDDSIIFVLEKLSFSLKNTKTFQKSITDNIFKQTMIFMYL